MFMYTMRGLVILDFSSEEKDIKAYSGHQSGTTWQWDNCN